MDFVADERIASGAGRPTRVDRPRIERAVREILLAIGEDPDRVGLRGTPSRVARSFEELGGGISQDAAEHLHQTFPIDGSPEVRVSGIEFFSLCEHHLLPFYGEVSISYRPCGGRVFGLSKLARLVEGLSRRLQIQERLTAEIADLVMASGFARSVSVEIEAKHLCMAMRGVRSLSAKTVTRESR